MNNNLLMQKIGIAIGISGFLLLAISRANFLDLDLFHQLALFREFIASGIFPYEDDFSYMETKYPIVHHEWGFGALMYIVINLFNLNSYGLLIFRYIIYAAIIYLCYLFARRNNVDLILFAPLCILTLALGFALPVIRAQILTQLFTIFFIFYVYSLDYKNKYKIFILAPIFVFWLNVHAGFLVGLGFIGLHTCERFFKSFMDSRSFYASIREINHFILLILIFCILIFINPYGYQYIPYLYDAVKLDRSIITEWQPLWDISLSILFLYIINVSLIIYALINNGIRKTPDILFVATLSWLALWNYKYMTVYSVVLLCFLPLYLRDTSLANALKNLPKSFPVIYVALWLGLAIITFGNSISIKFWELKIPTTLQERIKYGAPVYSVGVAQYLKDKNFTGNLMTPFNSGSYISWELYPAVRVSMDSRFEVAYPLDLVKENIRFYNAEEGWEKVLVNYPTHAILVPLWSNLADIAGKKIEVLKDDEFFVWEKVYIDDGFSLYVLESFDLPFVDNRGVVLEIEFPFRKLSL